MQFNSRSLVFIIFISVALIPFMAGAQVNTVEFGKNRIQYKKFTWKFYQSPNFYTYFNQGGLEIAKFASQVAEEELPQIENAVEYTLQRRANMVIYNNYEDYKSSNIGLGIDWQNPGGVTKLVNNKMILYFDGNKNNLRLQIREGIAKMLTDNILFGDDIGEFASNQALLDLPQWLTDGYVKYIAENWSTKKDDALKNEILSGDYKSFYQFAFTKPELAGNAFWHYIAETYKPENVTYFLYLARLYKNLNTASQRICKKKFKDVLADFMVYQEDRYVQDIKQRRNAPKGKLSVIEETNKADYYRFAANPNAKNNSYAVVQFKKGVYSIKYVDNLYEEKTLLTYGVRTRIGDINPNYPILAWDGKGSRLLVIYSKEGQLRMFVYDVIANIKRFQQPIEGFEQITEAGFMLDANTLLMSAVKKGQTDIFTYRIDNQKVKQITNDVYDELDPSFVSFPNRTGVLFASNRPGPDAPSNDTVLPSNYHFNIFLVDLLNNTDFKQITQLTKVKYGNARYPTQYNTNHFTFVNDENGIGNRWAGFFATQRDGLDTLYYIGDEVLRNPSDKEIDSTLTAWQKPEPDSVSYFSMYKDSTYTFPLTNYQSGLLESRIAGNNGQVSEVRREGDLKFLYKLKVDSVALRLRNVNARPTEYVKELLKRDRIAANKTVEVKAETEKEEVQPAFESEFDGDKPDSASAKNTQPVVPVVVNDIIQRRQNILSKSSLFDYRKKFSADYVLAGVTNNILINRYQPYQGGNGPIQLNNGNDLNFSFRVGVTDVMEDVKFIGGVRFGTTLSDKDVMLSFQNYRKRLDWGLTYYRSNVTNYSGFYAPGSILNYFDNVVVTNLYQANVSYPLDEIRSIRASFALRTDKGVLRPVDFTGYPEPGVLGVKDSIASSMLSRLEYVYDNSINPTQNIWNGLRYKVYFEYSVPLSKGSSLSGKTTYNLGADIRNYVKIYRNFIWATRAAADFSFGEAKMIYYLGGVDGWVGPKFNSANQPKPDNQYAFQSLAVNMRGFVQNVANGNNTVVLNSELRLPIFTTFFNKPINNAFLRNLQLVQFIDLGTAWNGSVKNIERPTYIYAGAPNTPVSVRQKAGGIGPLAGGYGFGLRSTLLGYFMKLDTAWPMNGLFRGKPTLYFALGFDF
ncbi:TolB-like translocation protein [Limnovirga soli]|uniref:Uncharacterized protein n=1 Tax=Limnovirga soli TaxID=2656915 RepID=A0A8J8FD76_9BACT|nr:hypothetical protein [Limnovirga soli]NNV55901.1 hypothetical protein [Limnovirga soli]